MFLPFGTGCPSSFLPSVPDIEDKRYAKSKQKEGQGQAVHQLFIPISPGQPVQKEFDVGVRIVRFAQSDSDLPVPIRAEAVPHALPQTDNEPGDRGYGEGENVPLSCPLPYPTEEVEDDERAVEDGKEDVQKRVHGSPQEFFIAPVLTVYPRSEPFRISIPGHIIVSLARSAIVASLFSSCSLAI